MTWEFNDSIPIFRQLIDQIQFKIISGEYPLGSKLPSVRELASEAAVNPNTMQRAFSELEQIGLVYSQRTTGRFITEDKELIRKIKTDLVREQVQNLIDNMRKFGFQKTEVLSMIKEIMGEMDL